MDDAHFGPGLRGLLLSNDGLDRAAHLRDDPDLTSRLLANSATRVVGVRGDRVLVDADHRLVYRSPEAADAERLTIFLGREPRGDRREPDDDAREQHGDGREPVGDGAWAAYLGVVEQPTVGDADSGWRTLRAAGALLSDRDAAIATTLLALANWHRGHEHCERCGGSTEPVTAGWVRRCTSDGSEHFPRTDSSVIMSVVDANERLLLGRGVTWPENQFSVLAGFVEPGESLEAAVVREVVAEAGVQVADVRYLGSQPWPFPSSLMLGFTARAVTTDLTHDPAELAEVRWVTRQEYAALLRSGAIRVPGAISIARRLIERWLGEDVETVAGGPVIEGWRPTR